MQNVSFVCLHFQSYSAEKIPAASRPTLSQSQLSIRLMPRLPTSSNEVTGYPLIGLAPQNPWLRSFFLTKKNILHLGPDFHDWWGGLSEEFTSLLHGSLGEGGEIPQHARGARLRCEANVGWKMLMGIESSCFFIWEHGTSFNSIRHNHEWIM